MTPMATATTWGAMNPNSGGQRWSQWTFSILAARRCPPASEVLDAARRFFRLGFKTDAGQVKVDVSGRLYTVSIQIEGPPCHDPDYRRQVVAQMRARFVAQGFGVGARLLNMDVRLLAGTAEDGSPAAQLLVLPPLHFNPARPH